MTLTVGDLQRRAGRLEQRARAIVLAQPLSAEDLRTSRAFLPARPQSRMGRQNKYRHRLAIPDHIDHLPGRVPGFLERFPVDLNHT